MSALTAASGCRRPVAQSKAESTTATDVGVDSEPHTAWSATAAPNGSCSGVGVIQVPPPADLSPTLVEGAGGGCFGSAASAAVSTAVQQTTLPAATAAAPPPQAGPTVE